MDRYIEQGFVGFSSPAVVKVRKPVAIAPKPSNQVTPVYVQRPVTLSPIVVKPQMEEEKENEEKRDYDLVASIIKQLTPHIQESVSSSLDGGDSRPSVASGIIPQTSIFDAKIPVEATSKPIRRVRPRLIPVNVSPKPFSIAYVDNLNPAVAQAPRLVTSAPKPITTVTPTYVPRPVTLPPAIVNSQIQEENGNESDYDLVASIIKQLTPHIQESVSTSLDGNDSGSSFERGVIPKSSIASSRIPEVTTTNPIRKVSRRPVAITVSPKTIQIDGEPKVEIIIARDNNDFASKLQGQWKPNIQESVSSSLESTTRNIQENKRYLFPDLSARSRNIPKEEPSFTSTLSIAGSASDGSTKVSDDNLASKLFEKLTPYIKESVASTLEGGSLPNLKEASDEELADSILAKLFPTITSKVRKTFDGNNYGGDLWSTSNSYQNDQLLSTLGQAQDQDSTDEILAKLAPSIVADVRKSLDGKNMKTLTREITYSSSPNTYDSSSDRDELISKVIPKFSIVNAEIPEVTTSDRFRRVRPRPVSSKRISIANERTEESDITKDDYDLVAKIIGQLTPHIQESVSTSLGSASRNEQKFKGYQPPGLLDVPENAAREQSSLAATFPDTSSFLDGSSERSDENVASKIIGDLTPYIKDTVTSTLEEGTLQNVKETSDEELADSILAKLTPTITSNIRKIVNHDDGPSFSSALYPYDKVPSSLDQISDQGWTDVILSQLTPSIVADVRKSLDDTPTERPIDQGIYSSATNAYDSKSNEDDFASKMFDQLTPYIKSSVASSLEGGSLPNLNGASDEELADSILAKLTPSITSRVRKTFRRTNHKEGQLGASNSYSNDPLFSQPDQNQGQVLTDTILDKLTPSIVANVRKSFEKTPTRQTIKSSSSNKNDSMSDADDFAEDLISKLVGQFTPYIKSSIASTLEGTSLPNSSKTTDEAVADSILLRLTPSTENKMRNSFDRSTPASILHTSGQYDSTSDRGDFISKILNQITPYVKTSVSTTLEDGSLPSFSQASDEDLTDSILAKLTPSITHRVTDSFNENYYGTPRLLSNPGTPRLLSYPASYKNNPSSTDSGQGQDSTELILSKLTPEIARSVRKSSDNGNKKTSQPTSSSNKNANLDSVANTEEDKLCYQILKELSPFIQGTLARYLSNQSSGSNIYDEVQKLPDDREFLDKLINELLPAIQTLARSKVAKKGKKA